MPLLRTNRAGITLLWLSLTVALTLGNLCGCTGIGRSMFPQRPVTARTNPQLPYEISQAELIEHLHREADSVRSWYSRDCRMVVRMPNNIPFRLKATIACEEPRNFRLVADGSMIAHADIGSNHDYCWWWLKPGDNVLFTVAHEDMNFVRNHPLMTQAMSMPFEPDWLMQVLGVTRLDTEGMSMHADRHPERRNLVSEFSTEDGRLFRRVTIVDLHAGHVVGHRLVDSANNTVVRAKLLDFGLHGDATLPARIEIDWPDTNMSLTITIRGLRVNGDLPPDLWQPPQDRSLPRIPLAGHLRQMERAQAAMSQNTLRVQPHGMSDPSVQGMSGSDEDLPWDDNPPRPWFRRLFGR